MKKAALVINLVVLVQLVAELIVQAHQVAKVRSIGLLSNGSPASGATLRDAFRQRLRELGYEEGKDISFEYRYAEGKLERLPGLAAELVHLNVDLIVTTGQAVTLRGSLTAALS